MSRRDTPWRLRRLRALLIEVKCRLYMDEASGDKLAIFVETLCVRLGVAADDAKAAAPLLGVEVSRLVLFDESLEHRDEACRSLEMR